MIKKAYIAMIRLVGRVASAAGLFAMLERHKSKRWAHWLLSLFAIHDVDRMIALDVPWWPYNAIDRVEAFLKAQPGARVFEYGSGASTIWLSRRAGIVTSVEHDPSWFALMTERTSAIANITVKHVPADSQRDGDPVYHSSKEGYAGASFRAYAQAIAGEGCKFDLIVIDGRGREGCLHVAADYLADGGMIVFDNTKRARYRKAISNSGLKIDHIAGLTPALPYSDSTTLLTNRVSHPQ